MSIHLPPQDVIQGSEDDIDSGSCVSSSDEDEDQDDPKTWDDWVSDSQENKECYSLFEDKKLSSVQSALEYDEQTHGFNLDRISSKLGDAVSPPFCIFDSNRDKFPQLSTFTSAPGSSTTPANRSHSLRLDDLVRLTASHRNLQPPIFLT